VFAEVFIETGEARRESQLVRVIVTEDAMSRCGDGNIGRFQSQESMEKMVFRTWVLGVGTLYGAAALSLALLLAFDCFFCRDQDE
jgi:hypothetical protein